MDTNDGTATHVVAADAATLVYLAQQACVTLHGWASRADRIDRPDRLLIDLDPSKEDAAGVRRAARDVAALLGELGLAPLPLATGSRGYHLIVPLQRRHGYDEVRRFARDAGRVAAARDPRRLTTEFLKRNRDERIYVDTGRNRYGHTAVVPWSVRARPRAPVATPLHRDELEDARMRADRFTVRAARRRLEDDPWAGARPATLGGARGRLDAALEDAGLEPE